MAVSGVGWWARSDLNRGPSDYESPALTAELRARQITASVHFARVRIRGKLIRQLLKRSSLAVRNCSWQFW